jgi:hypothetical protein
MLIVIIVFCIIFAVFCISIAILVVFHDILLIIIVSLLVSIIESLYFLLFVQFIIGLFGFLRYFFSVIIVNCILIGFSIRVTLLLM